MAFKAQHHSHLDPGTYYLESRLQPPVFWYQRPAIGEERFTQKTLQFLHQYGINPKNTAFKPEYLWITYRISPLQNWSDQTGATHTGFCTCKGFSIRKTCRHLETAKLLSADLLTR
jgi:hypothetical protein